MVRQGKIRPHMNKVLWISIEPALLPDWNGLAWEDDFHGTKSIGQMPKYAYDPMNT